MSTSGRPERVNRERGLGEASRGPRVIANRRLARRRGPIADQDRAILGPCGRHAVAALAPVPASSGITSNKRAETQLLLDEPPNRAAFGPPQAGVEKQLAGIVARLAVDVDRSREIGSQAVVEPVRIGKPRVGLRQDHELAARGWSSPISRRSVPARTRATPGSADQLVAHTAGIVGPRRHKRARPGGRRRRTPGCQTCRAFHQMVQGARSETPPRAARDSAGSAGSRRHGRTR